jgi:hypothetical protein
MDEFLVKDNIDMSIDPSLGGTSVSKDVELYYAEVLSVDEERRTCNLAIRGQHAFPLADVPYTLPFLSPGGASIDFIPAIGSLCIVAKQLSNLASELDSNPFILGFRPVNRDSTWLNNRMDLAINDIVLSSEEKNRLELLSDGSVKLMANEACSIEMSPVTNKILTYCSSYVLHTGGGYLEWLVDSSENVGSSHFKAAIKTKSDLEIGSSELLLVEAGDSGTPKVTVKVLNPEASSNSSSFLWECTATGEVTLDVTKSINTQVGESISITSMQSTLLQTPILDIRSGDSSVSLSQESMVIDAPTVTIRTDSFLVQNRSGEQIFVRGEVEEVEDTLNKQLVTEDILSWVFNHIHPGNGAPALGRPMNTSEIKAEELSVEQEAQAMAEAKGISEDVNSDEIEEILRIVGVAATTVTPPEIIANLIVPILNLLLGKYTSELESVMSATSPDADLPAGVLNSYSQVLTQDTKVR